jgi:hypothetical protein
MVLRRGVLLGGAAVAIAYILLAGCGLLAPRAGSNAFSHARHAAKGITCGACHQDHDAAAVAGMPSYGTCLACHGPAADRSPYEFEQEIQGHPPSQPFAASPRYDDLKFSHAVHSARAVPCESCHGDLDDTSLIGREPPAHAARCESCHREREVSADCSTCHERLRRDLPPPSHQTVAWDRLHGRDPAYAWDEMHERNCSLCHSRGYCDNCHRVEKPLSHTEFFRQRGHGIAAGIQREPCQACHEENFCIRCHREEQPRSHFSASWAGATSNHCLSCHELSQSSCFVCHKSTPSHQQATPIPPPPHPAASANCYQCHLRPPHGDNKVTPCISCHR